MEKLEMFRIGIEVIATLAIAYLSNRTFKYKDSLTALIRASKDAKVTEAEFQEITDQIRKDIYGE